MLQNEEKVYIMQNRTEKKKKPWKRYNSERGECTKGVDLQLAIKFGLGDRETEKRH